ncbi:MAG: prepilin-type N-terminal cleavage/methylation domain-containing protein [Paeniclostridium sordellii]|nr:prepilin-type N-terminal cleavage/methylation domain-containing protein [Paeniclostridium sordellii]
MLKKKKGNKGFTLIELLVVIAIIGILAVVAVPALFRNIEKAKAADLESDISAIKSASLSYYGDHGSYPDGALKVTNEGITAVNSDGSSLEEGKPNGASKVAKEVENLSFPFEGTYKFEGSVPGALLLKISPGDGKSISVNVVEKLKKDLGNEMVTPPSEAEINTTPLTIKLINNKNN